jgi:chemotaxis methyl-accepting protein methylase
MGDSAATEPRQRLRRLVTDRLGIGPSALPDERVDGALDRAMAVLQPTAPSEAIDRLTPLPLESAPWQRVVDAVVIGETSFFRQPAWFERLEEHVLGPLIEQRRRDGPRRLRVWSAACATAVRGIADGGA